MVAPQILTEEHGDENGTAPLGVGLEVSAPLAFKGGKYHHPQNKRGQRSDPSGRSGRIVRAYRNVNPKRWLSRPRMVSSICIRRA